MTYAHASCDETIDHFETLHETGSLSDNALFTRLLEKLNRLGGKLNLFIQGVEAQHLSVRDEPGEYGATMSTLSRISYLASRIENGKGVRNL